MVKDIESHNTQTDPDTSSFWMPSRLQTLLYLLISLLILIAFNFRDLWNYLNTVVLADEGSSGLSSWFSGDIQTRVLQVIFWLFVGCMVYVFIWFANNVITNIRNDIVAGSYIYPSDSSKDRYWQSVLGYKVSFVAIVIIFLGFIYFGYKMARQLADWANEAVSDYSWHQSLPKLLGCLLGMALLIYLLTRLVHLVAATGQAVFKGL